MPPLRILHCPPLRSVVLAASLVLAILLPTPTPGQTVLTADEYRLLPLRVHLLRAGQVPALNCGLQAKDARRILGKINGIWRQAGIQFYAESLLAEEAANQELYRGLGENLTEGHLRLVRPRASQSDRSFHLYYIGEMRPNGICLQGSYQLLFVKETARLRKVPGGIDEDLPRVSAHEIGHALSLPHRQNTTNLMASGTTGTGLNDGEIAASRETAARLEWCLKPLDALRLGEKLETDQRTAEADAVYTALSGLPGGDVARLAKMRLEARKPDGS